MSKRTESGELGNGDWQTDDRAPFAKALDVASQITAICLTLAFLIVGGIVVDHWIGTTAVFTALGTLLGLFAAGHQLMRLVHRLDSRSKSLDEFDRSTLSETHRIDEASIPADENGPTEPFPDKKI